MIVRYPHPDGPPELFSSDYSWHILGSETFFFETSWNPIPNNISSRAAICQPNCWDCNVSMKMRKPHPLSPAWGPAFTRHLCLPFKPENPAGKPPAKTFAGSLLLWGKSKWGLSRGGLRPLSATRAQSSATVHFSGLLPPFCKGNRRP